MNRLFRRDQSDLVLGRMRDAGRLQRTDQPAIDEGLHQISLDTHGDRVPFVLFQFDRKHGLRLFQYSLFFCRQLFFGLAFFEDLIIEDAGLAVTQRYFCGRDDYATEVSRVRAFELVLNVRLVEGEPANLRSTVSSTSL